MLADAHHPSTGTSPLHRLRSGTPMLLAGLAVVGLLGLTLGAHGGASGTPELVVGLLIATGGWGLGHWLGSAAAWLPGALVAGCVTAIFLVTLPQSLSGAANAPPLGYANADGALLAVAVAGMVSARLTVAGDARPWASGAAALLAGACALTGSRAATVVSVLLLAVVPAHRYGSPRWWQFSAIALVATGVGLTTAVGAAYTVEGSPAPLEEALSPTRAALWSDALALAKERPALGIGPGEFAHTSTVALADADLGHVHSAPLQSMAELGWTGFALVALVFVALVWRLGRSAVILALLTLQSLVDYVLAFAPVVLATAVVLGGLAAPRSGGGRGDRAARRW